MTKLFKRKMMIVVVLAVIAITTVTIISINTTVIANSPVTGEIQLPADVKQVLMQSCYDCHSNETKLHWYNKLPIAASLARRDITKARKHFNFSEWNKLSPNEQNGLLWEMYNMVNAGEMPLPSYTALHPGAKVSPTGLSILRNYLNTIKVDPAFNADKEKQADSQYLKWVNRYAPPDSLPVSANGIKHMPEYRNWQVMSTTSRLDNGTMRVMYANPVAYNAIKTGRINPWPNGSVIVKLVWEKLVTASGDIRPGKFLNVQYMVRDSEKFKDTKGWGYAKFETPALKPDNESPSKCASCHQAANQTGYVFDLSTKD
ncbi:hypothetical protein A3860_05625 [Niastella vici]|uniref:Haem-binding domain-containing protein n=1 Tax=Niastella vici TaxID=1703345 RepID=A0A1V9FS72_9BACT|nr:heme-binding domain-containing protein [Niastella vici]OQP61192.1 hypothetical protein A3860_05625 [Niastella vici]